MKIHCSSLSLKVIEDLELSFLLNKRTYQAAEDGTLLIKDDSAMFQRTLLFTTSSAGHPLISKEIKRVLPLPSQTPP